MLVLIELYDHREPINNVITLSAYHPEKLVVLGDSSVSKQRAQKYIDRYIAASDLQTETEYVPCRAYDLDQVEESLKGVIGRYGAENCVIDVIGGSEILLMAAGSCCREFSALRVVTQKKKTDEFVCVGKPELSSAYTVCPYGRVLFDKFMFQKLPANYGKVVGAGIMFIAVAKSAAA